jgi:polyferredoxin
MKFLTLLLIIGFASIAVFGFIAMNDNEGGHTGCIAATAQGAVCPSTNLGDFIAFHANAFRVFSTATFAPSVLSLIALALLAFAGFALTLVLLRENPLRRFLHLHVSSRSADTRTAEHELLLRSLALRELSPAFA